MAAPPGENLKCVLVGDRSVGKSSLLMSFVTNKCLPASEEVPEVYDASTTTVSLGEVQYNLDIFDIDGNTQEHKKRALMYPYTDAFLICFSVISPQSFQHVEEDWAPEIAHHCPGTPWVLVGTKIDRRGDPDVLERLSAKGESVITTEQGKILAMKLRAFAYVECSAKTMTGLKEAFDEVSFIVVPI
ncbi:cell division cycle 42 [Clavulina sp. PMI_390]|nr:cell division cycle 42 [Clavulina sp. PMI_390]